MKNTRGAMLIIVACACQGASGLDLVVDGYSDYTILGNATDPAVQDLQTYLARISGATLPIARCRLPII
jgi:hypothetical protein